MKAGCVVSMVLCGGAIQQRINYSVFQVKCTYKKISDFTAQSLSCPSAGSSSSLPLSESVWYSAVSSKVRFGTVPVILREIFAM